jgi:hypothetical protein
MFQSRIEMTSDFLAARSHLVEAVALFEGNSAPFGVYRSRFRLAEAQRMHGLWPEFIENYRRAFDLQRSTSSRPKARICSKVALTGGTLHR